MDKTDSKYLDPREVEKSRDEAKNKVVELFGISINANTGGVERPYGLSKENLGVIDEVYKRKQG